MLPPLQLGHTERHEVRLEERPRALQDGEEPPVELRQRELQPLRIRAAGERQRLPSQLVEVVGRPHRLKGRRVAGAEQSLQRPDEATQQR